MRNFSIVSNTFLQNLSEVALPMVAIGSTTGLNISANRFEYVGSGPHWSNISQRHLPLAIAVGSSTNVTLGGNLCRHSRQPPANDESATCKATVAAPAPTPAAEARVAVATGMAAAATDRVASAGRVAEG